MERKITHYVVKPEHQEHASLFGTLPDDRKLSVNHAAHQYLIKKLTEAKVLDLWTYPVYEKPRVKGWYNVYSDTNTLFGGQKTKEEAAAAHGIINRIGQIFIDQEIE